MFAFCTGHLLSPRRRFVEAVRTKQKAAYSLVIRCRPFVGPRGPLQRQARLSGKTRATDVEEPAVSQTTTALELVGNYRKLC